MFTLPKKLGNLVNNFGFIKKNNNKRKQQKRKKLLYAMKSSVGLIILIVSYKIIKIHIYRKNNAAI